METAESLARKALNRLRRAAEKVQRELDTLEGALSNAEGEDFPAAAYQEARLAATTLLTLVDEEASRLQEKILHAGGLEAGRIRRG